jgi:hypothetical protein
MSPELYQKIDWEAKLDRGAENVDMLIEDGRKRAREFLEARKRVVDGHVRNSSARGTVAA